MEYICRQCFFKEDIRIVIDVETTMYLAFGAMRVAILVSFCKFEATTVNN